MIHWSTIDPADAVDLNLSERLDIVAPLNEDGERCPWPWGPQQLVGVPMGQYHCPRCGAMVMAGVAHIDYRERPHDEHDGTDPGCPECAAEAGWIDPGTWPYAATTPEAVAHVAAVFRAVLTDRSPSFARSLALLAVETLVGEKWITAKPVDVQEEWAVSYTVTDPDGARPLVKDADRSESDHGTFETRAEAERHMAAWASHYAASLAYRDIRYHRRTSWTGPWAAAE